MDNCARKSSPRCSAEKSTVRVEGGRGLGWRLGAGITSAEQSPAVPAATCRGVPAAGEAEPRRPRVPGCSAGLRRGQGWVQGASPQLCRRRGQVRGAQGGRRPGSERGAGRARGEPRLRVERGARSQPSGTFSDGLNAI